MFVGATLFSQVMDYLPWCAFHRIVSRYRGDYRVRTFRCSEQLRVMTFAQMTYRESLRDIEACLTAQAQKLYHMGISSPVSRSTLADANETRPWRIYAELAQRLIAQARKLYAGEPLAFDLDNTVYALDSTTIDLCLSVFPWAHFRTEKAAIKLHTLLDIRGAIPSFIHISDGKLHDINALDILVPEAGAFYVMDRAYLDFQRLYALHQAGSFFVTRAKVNLDARRVYSAQVDRTTGVMCDQLIALNGHYSSLAYPEQIRRIRYKVPDTGRTLVFLSNHKTLPALTICALYKSRWEGRAVLQVDQAEPSHQKLLWNIRECGKDSNLDCRVGVCLDGNYQKTLEPGVAALHYSTDFVSYRFRENALAASVCGNGLQYEYGAGL